MKDIIFFFEVVAVLVTVSSAYDFDNADYNLVLGDKLEDLYDNSQISNLRNRRDASEEDDKCRRKKHKLCCGEEYLQKRHESKKDEKSACFKEITGKDKPPKHFGGKPPFDLFNCEKVQQRKDDMMCIFQCVGQKYNILDKDGNVQPEEFGNYVKENLADIKYLDPVQDKIIEGCLEDIKNATKSEGKCKSDGLILDFCLFKNIQLNCPEDQIKDKDVCKKIQERIKQGRDFHGPPPPPLD